MSTTPLYIGRSEALDRLGVCDTAFSRLVRMGFVRKHVLPGMTYGSYYEEDVKRLETAGVPLDPNIEAKIRKLMEMETNGYK